MAKTPRAPRSPRARAPEAPVQADQAVDAAGPVEVVPAPAAPAAPATSAGDGQPPCLTPSSAGGRCWQITRARYKGGKTERYCESCGAIESSTALPDRLTESPR